MSRLILPQRIKTIASALFRKHHFFRVLIIPLLFLQDTTLAKDVKIKGDQEWLYKEKVIKKITQNKEILVSVKVEDGTVEEALKNLKIQCVGLVSKPLQQTFSIAKSFHLLPQVSDHIKKAEFDASGQELYLHTEAFNYHAHLWMKLRIIEDSEKKKNIHFEVIRGAFKGMKGDIRFLSSENGKTRMELFSDYPFRQLPVPNFFVEFGLEVATQRVASRMRTYIETKDKGTLDESKNEKSR